MNTLAPIDAYRLLAAEYDRGPNPLLALERRMLPGLLPDLRGLNVVDAAAGTGFWADYCLEHGARPIAVDFCWEMLQRLAQHGAARCLADVNALPLRDSFADVTICAFALAYAPRCLSELARVTRPGGVILASDVHPDTLRRGWTRSFRSEHGVVHVAHEPYELADLEIPELRLDTLWEPRLEEPERIVFEEAGKGSSFEEASRHPAIFIARWARQ